jgi:hypothetical protein
MVRGFNYGWGALEISTFHWAFGFNVGFISLQIYLGPLTLHYYRPQWRKQRQTIRGSTAYCRPA